MTLWIIYGLNGKEIGMYKCKKCGYEQKDSSFNVTVLIGGEEVGEYCLCCIAKHFNQLGLGKVEKVEEEIDWAKVPKDQPVLVRDNNNDDEDWFPRYFSKPGYTCGDGETSRTVAMNLRWKQMRLDPDAKPIFNWHRWHGGERPVDGDVYVNYVIRNGDYYTHRAENLRWGHAGAVDYIIWYSVAQPLDDDGWPKV